MSVSTDRLMNSIRIRAPGAIDDAIHHELFAVADEFFRNTDAWQEEISLSVNASNLTYDIESDEANAEIVRLLSLTSNGTPVKGILKSPNELTVLYAPSITTYKAIVSLTVADPVADDFPELPDWAIAKFREGFTDGVLSRMLSQPAKPYTNNQMALYHFRRFRNAIAVARMEARNGYLAGGQSWVYPQAFVGR